MKCSEIKRMINFGATSGLKRVDEIEGHVAGCLRCRDLVGRHQLASLLIRTGIEVNYENTEAWMSPILMMRIKERIRELGDQGAGSWESAILAMRGWLVAFGTVAVILLSLTVPWQLFPEKPESREHDPELHTISNVTEVLISENMTRQFDVEDAGPIDDEANNDDPDK